MKKDSLLVIFADLGMFLQVPALLALPSAVVAVIFGEWYALVPFGVMAVISLTLGQLLYRLFRSEYESPPSLSLVLVAVVWLCMSLLGIIPFYGTALALSEANAPTAVFLEPINAFFESMSGFTGTGLTMVGDPSQLPRSLQWWRSLTEWVGGVGVIMVGMVLLSVEHDGEKLYQAATRSWMLKDQEIETTVMRMWWIYGGYTLASIAGFFLAGMPFWEALNHGMTGISTGGFAVTSDSFIGYSPPIKVVAIVVMLIGAFSFKIHYFLLIRREPLTVFRQTQLRYFVGLVLVFAAILLTLDREASALDSLFQLASAIGSCGFNSDALAGWPLPVLFLLTIAMIVGGNGSSTSGGIKTIRVAWLFKGFLREMDKVWNPDKPERPYYYNHREVKPGDAVRKIRQAATLIFLYMMALALGTLGLSVFVGEQYPLQEILFDTASALANVGLSAGVSGVGLPSGAKMLLILLMWLGRLEVFAVLMLLSTPLWLVRRRFAQEGK